MPDGCATDTLTVPRSAATRSRMFASPPVDAVAALRGTVSVSAAQPSGTTVLVDLPVDRLDRAADREADPVG